MTLAQDDPPGSAPPVDPSALQTLMCRAGLAVAVVDAAGRLSMLSPGLQHLLHRACTDVPAESLAEVFHLHTADGTRLLEPDEVPILRASRGEVVDDALVTVKAPGQPVRHLRVNATPIVGPQGERRGAWAVMTDVTGLLAAARGELDRTLAETMNHDLRTPLTTLLCHAELLLDHPDDLPPDVARSLRSLWRAAQRLKDAVTSVSVWIDLAYGPRGAGTELAGRASTLERPPASATATDGRGALQVVPHDTGPSARVATRGRADLDGAVDLIDVGLLCLDRDGRVRFVNDAAARLLGHTADDLCGQDIWREPSPGAGSVLDHRYRTALASRRRVVLEKYVEPLDAWFSIGLHPFPDGTTTVLRDITSERALSAARRSYVDRLVEAEDRERARIAADVHDDSLQALGAASLQLQLLQAHLSASAPVVQSLLDGLGHQVADATDRLRTLLFRLEPTRTDVPIAHGIRTQAAHIFDGSPIHWSVDDVDAGRELAPAERSQALRVTKEALSNVRAHARATEVIVTLRGDETGVEIVIADNGCAADPATLTSAPGHRGLQTMRDRAADVGGSCTIEPSAPHGCTVRLYVPRIGAP